MEAGGDVRTLLLNTQELQQFPDVSSSLQACQFCQSIFYTTSLLHLSKSLILGLSWYFSGYGCLGASRVVLVVKNQHANAGDVGDMGSIPGSGRSRGEGPGNPFQYSCLENPMDSGAWRAAVHSVAERQTWLKRLSTHGCLIRMPTAENSENVNEE